MKENVQQPVTIAAGNVPAVVRAKAILDLVAQRATPISVSEIARALSLAKSTAHGLCNTLLDLALLNRLPGGNLILGGHIMFWANAFAGRTNIVGSFMQLWDETPEVQAHTITLSTLDGDYVTYIACREGRDPLGITFRIGMRLPAAFTATGKAMLSTLPATELERMFAEGMPEPLTRMSVRSYDALAEEIEQVRERGYSVDNGQVREGMYCFGAPLHSFSGPRAVGGIAISVLARKLTPACEAQFGALVRRCAGNLSENLGGRRDAASTSSP